MDEEAKTLAHRAAEQAKHAAKNGEKAIEFVAEDAADHIDARAISFGLGNGTQGFIALGIATYMGAVAYSKFRSISR